MMLLTLISIVVERCQGYNRRDMKDGCRGMTAGDK